jgi:hypothetical protein
MFAIRAKLKEKRKQKRIRVANKSLLKRLKKYEPKKKWYAKRFTKHLPNQKNLIAKTKTIKKASFERFVPRIRTNSLIRWSKTKNSLKKINIFVPKTNFLTSNNIFKPLKNKKIETKNLNAKKKNKTENKTKSNQKGYKGNKNQTNYTNLFPKKRTIAYKYIKKSFFFTSL